MKDADFIVFRDSLQIGNYDSSRSVLNSGDGRYYLINEKTSKLILRLKQSKSWEEVYQYFLIDEDTDLSLEEFKRFVYSVLNISTGETSEKRKSYLRLRLTIIKEKYAGVLGDFLSFLFKKDIFLFVFALFLVINICLLAFTSGNIVLSKDGWSYVIVFLLYSSSIIFHETGHIAACKRFGAEHGGIGIGFYLVFPVFWADVTGLWMLPRKERVITNLAGIHAQLFLNIIYFGAYLITGMPFLLVAADFIVLTSLFQLWPFMRYDGYWILSDILETPNLMKISGRKIKDLLLEWMGKKCLDKRTRKDWYLIIYAFSNTLLTIFYLLFVLTNHSEIVIHYPSVTMQVVTSLVDGHFVSTDFLMNYLIVSLFYYIVVKRSIEFGIKYIRQNRRQLLHMNSLEA